MVSMTRWAGIVVLAAVGLMVEAAGSHAQVTTADVVGRVTDASGAALPPAPR